MVQAARSTAPSVSIAEQTAAKAFGQLHWQRLGGGSEDQDSEYTDSLALPLAVQLEGLTASVNQGTLQYFEIAGKACNS